MSVTRTTQCTAAPECYIVKVWQGMDAPPQQAVTAYGVQYHLYGVISRQDRSGASCPHYVSWLLTDPACCWFYDCLGLDTWPLPVLIPKDTRAMRGKWPPSNLVPALIVYVFYLRVPP
jgi:hypothetical protein